MESRRVFTSIPKSVWFSGIAQLLCPPSQKSGSARQGSDVREGRTQWSSDWYDCLEGKGTELVEEMQLTPG